ncbi:MAG: AbrB/MazE/SpoVT family DNA-binding domain-containing protein [Gammaproteobacteria bacterium]|nr:AbrB/MazE/SpoVT family DNA-binding domain-containing protein [Gammaproteobacteria bacterium]
MIITIDHAGRLVVPKSLREQFNLTPGCDLEIEALGDGIRIRRTDAEPALVRKQGILVHHGTTRTALDIGDFVRAERNARHARVARDADAR